MADRKLQIVLTAKDLTGKAFERTQGKITALTRKVFSLRGAFVAAAAATGAGYFVKRQLEVADAIGKTADKIGIGTEALQEYRHAAELSGVGTRTADMALQRFSRRMGEAAQGTGEALKVVEKYGIQVRDSNGAMRSNLDIMGDWAEVIKNAESEQEALRIAFKLFDSEGAAMVNMLRGGRSAMEAMREDARQLGIVLNDELVRGAEEANDQVTRLSRVVGMQFTRAAAELAPTITDISTDMTDWVREQTRLQELGVDNFFDSVAAGAERLASAVGTIARHAGLRSILGTLEQAAELSQQGRLGMPMRDFLAKGFHERQRIVDERLGNTTETGAPIFRGKIPPPPGKDDSPTLTPVLFGGGGAGGTGAESESAFLKKVEQLHKEAQASIGNGWVNQSKRLQEALRAQEQRHQEFTAKAVRMHQEAVNSITQAYPNMADRLDQALAAPDAYFGKLKEEAETAAGDMEQAFTGWARGWSSTLNDMLWGAETTFQDIARSFAQMITQMAIQKSIVEPIAEGVSSSGVFGWLADLFHGGGIVGKDSGQSRAMPAMAFAGAPRLHGGLAPDEYPAILQRGEGVFTRDQMKALGGAPNVQVNVIDNTSEKKDITHDEPRWNGERWVMNVVLDAANHNKSGFGRNLKAALGKA